MIIEERLHVLNKNSYLGKDGVFKRTQDAIGIKLSHVNSPFKLINLYYKDSPYVDVAAFEKSTLLEKERILTQKIVRNRTSLHYAAIQGYTEVAKPLFITEYVSFHRTI